MQDVWSAFYALGMHSFNAFCHSYGAQNMRFYYASFLNGNNYFGVVSVPINMVGPSCLHVILVFI